jgi:hypothetical protein
MSSWKQYGGTNKLNKTNNINVNNFSAKSFILYGPYEGNFDICGNLHVENSLEVLNNAVFDSNITVNKNMDLSGDVNIQGNVNIGQSLNLINAGIKGNIIIDKNSTVKGNSYIYDTLYFDPLSKEFLRGQDNKIGVNVYHPQSTLDICGNISSVFNVYSNQETTKNTLVRNMNHRGIQMKANTRSSSIEFYNDTSFNGNIFQKPDARIKYDQTGILNFDVSTNIQLNANTTISNRSQKQNVLNETLVIYDNLSGSYLYETYKNNTEKTGNALSLIAQDSSSNTFLNIVTPDKKGVSIVGGSFPNDQTRSMGTIGWIDNTNEFVPSQIIVSGNNAAKYRSTIGINTYSPKIDNYILDINGPTHISNGYLKMVNNVPFEIKKISTMRQFGNSIIGIGSPNSIEIFTDRDSTINTAYNQSAIYSKDGGQTWNKSRINGYSIIETVFTFFYSIYTYDSNFSIISGLNSIYFTTNGGITWNPITFTSTFSNKIFNSIYIDSSYVYFSIIDKNENINNTQFNYFLNPYTSSLTTTNNLSTEVIRIRSNGRNLDNPSINIIAIHGSNKNIYVITKQILKYEFISDNFTILNSNSHNYTSIYTLDGKNTIAVGNNIISYSYDGSLFTDLQDGILNNIKLNSVYIFDSSSAIVVGDSAIILFSKDGYKTWTQIPKEILNSAGNSNILYDLTCNYNSVTMSDANTIVISATIQKCDIPQYDSNGNIIYQTDSNGNNIPLQYGYSKLFYCFLPNLFNHVNNDVLDVSGNMFVSGDIYVENNLTVNQTVLMNEGNDSWNITTGTLQVIGGVGITGNTNIGGNVSINSGIESFNKATGALIIKGGAGILGNTNIGGNVSINSGIESFNKATGALIVKGGAGILGNTNIGGNVSINSGIESFNNTTGAFIVTGGVGISGNTNIGGNVNIQNKVNIFNGVESNNTTTGSFLVSGGVGISGNTNIGGNLNIKSNINSVSNSTGALIIVGGVGIGGNINMGGNLAIQSINNSNNSSTGAFVVQGGIGVKKDVYIDGNVVNQQIIYTSGIQGFSSDSNSGIAGGDINIGTIGGSNFNNINIGGVFDSNPHNTRRINIGGSHDIISLSGEIVTQTASILGDFTIGGNIIADTNFSNLFKGIQESYNTSTGLMVIEGGGMGISGNINTGKDVNIGRDCSIGGSLLVNKGIDSTNSSTGSIVVKGGAGITGNMNIDGSIKIGNNIGQNIVESTQINNGKLIIFGGVGISSNLNIGGNMNTTGISYMNNTMESISTSTGSLIVSGGVGISKNLNIGGNSNVTAMTPSNSTTTGAIIVTGGVGIGGNINIGGNTNTYGISYIKNTSESGSTSTGSLVVSGGAGVSGNLNIGGNLNVMATTPSNSINTGSFVVAGGVGIGGNLNIDGNVKMNKNVSVIGNLNVTATTPSNSTNTGAFVVLGGIGIGGNINTSGIVNIQNTNDGNSANSSVGALVVNGGVGVVGNITTGNNIFIYNNKSIYSQNFQPYTNNTNVNLLTNGTTGIVMGNVNTPITFNSNIFFNNTTNSTGYNNGSLIVNGGIGVSGEIYTNGNIIILNNNTLYSQNIQPTQPINPFYLLTNINNNTSTNAYHPEGIIFGNISTKLNINSHSYFNGNIYCSQITTNNGNLNITTPIGQTLFLNSNKTANSGDLIINNNSPQCNMRLSYGNFYLDDIRNGGAGIFCNKFFPSFTQNVIQLFSDSTSSNPNGINFGYYLTPMKINSPLTMIQNSSNKITLTVQGNIILGNLFISPDFINIGNTYTGVLPQSGSCSFDLSNSSGNISFSNRIYVTSGINSISQNTGAIIVTGGIGVSGNTNIGGNTNIMSTSASTSTTTGALTVNGGLGVGGNMYVGGQVIFQNTTNSSDSNSGALVLSGGVGMTGNINVGGNANVKATSVSTSTNTGALIVGGGVGIGGNLFMNTSSQSIVFSSGSYPTGCLSRIYTDYTTNNVYFDYSSNLWFRHIGSSSGIRFDVCGNVFCSNVTAGSMSSNDTISVNNIRAFTNSSIDCSSGTTFRSGTMNVDNLRCYIGGATGNIDCGSLTTFRSGTMNVNSIRSYDGTNTGTIDCGTAATFKSGTMNVDTIRSYSSNTIDCSSVTTLKSGTVYVDSLRPYSGLTGPIDCGDSTTFKSGTIQVDNISCKTGSTITVNSSVIFNCSKIYTSTLTALGTGYITSDSIYTSGNIRTNNLYPNTGTIIDCGSGNIISCGTLKATNISPYTGDTSLNFGAYSVTCGTIKSSGDISNNGLIRCSGALTCGAITSSGTFSCGSYSLTCGAITSSGTFSCGSYSLTCGAITSSGDISNNGQIKCSGKITCSDISSNGNIYCGNTVTSGSFNATSDYRIKKNVQLLDPYFVVDNIRPVTYDNILLNKKDIGLIAHEVQEIYPFLVNGIKDDPDMNQSVNYIGFISILIKEVQDLKKRVSMLENNK